ncbi:reticulon-like protein B5 [Punica granatum]|uniref:Reticulon-like protein B5 n=2 Tax=Punica granatum TaxID=22663 RepID=A0A6P8DVC7_PUNGR|nr:reticulon-like protein B5 [Punica granatum]PKI46343.1 hypothetical protein CRG98_033238 [Punica granatum]
MAEETVNETPTGEPVSENASEEMHDGHDDSLSSSSNCDSDTDNMAACSSAEAKMYRLFGREKSVHEILGRGKAADMLLWRNKKISSTVLGGATVVWVLFILLEYRFLTLISHVLILLLSTLFLWSNAMAFVKKSRPHIPGVFIPEEPFLQIASAVRLGLNQSLAILREAACGRDLKKFLAIIAGLWMLSIVGSWCNFLTLLYLSFILLHTLPVLYEKYEHRVDPLAERAISAVRQRYSRLVAIVLSKIPMGGIKRKAI